MSTAQARLREFLPSGRELAWLFLARGLACLAAWATGFRALSDDDYARVSIAQGFAAVPRWDPTFTSWLPAPFWAYGAAFRAFGSGLEVARATAIAASLAATVLVYVAARMLAASPRVALFAAMLSCFVVYSKLLGIAPVPEVPCAALILFAAAALAQQPPAMRVWGALALLAATLSRYEAWPVAFAFAGFCVCDALKERHPGYVAAAALALAGPAAWLLSGRVEHGQAWFFIGRVTAYRQALGAPQESVLAGLAQYPVLLLRSEPDLCGLSLLFFAAGKRWKFPRRDALNSQRCVCALLAMLVFLMLGTIRGGVPTHHAARVLLPIWFFLCILAVSFANDLPLAGPKRVRVALLLASAAMLFLADWLRLPVTGFANRALELEAGSAARKLTDHGVAIDTPDYGYTAVQAAFGTPIGTRALDEHDPRHPDPDPFASPQALEAALRERGASFALVTTKHAPLLTKERGFAELWRSEAFVLFAWQPSPRS